MLADGLEIMPVPLVAIHRLGAATGDLCYRCQRSQMLLWHLSGRVRTAQTVVAYKSSQTTTRMLRGAAKRMLPGVVLRWRRSEMGLSLLDETY
jgi:hypothetical protein